MAKAKELPEKVKRIAADAMARELDQLEPKTRNAAVGILEALADLSNDRALIVLAMAKLALAEDRDARRLAERVLRFDD